jgi:oligopeptide/dipeptide ABC transporter ATP-binding protein
LLRALPEPDRPRGELLPIPGQPPSPGDLPSGCPFRTRCDYATDECAEREPVLTAAVDAASVACHHALSRPSAEVG